MLRRPLSGRGPAEQNREYETGEPDPTRGSIAREQRAMSNRCHENERREGRERHDSDSGFNPLFRPADHEIHQAESEKRTGIDLREQPIKLPGPDPQHLLGDDQKCQRQHDENDTKCEVAWPCGGPPARRLARLRPVPIVTDKEPRRNGRHVAIGAEPDPDADGSEIEVVQPEQGDEKERAGPHSDQQRDRSHFDPLADRTGQHQGQHRGQIQRADEASVQRWHEPRDGGVDVRRNEVAPYADPQGEHRNR